VSLAINGRFPCRRPVREKDEYTRREFQTGAVSRCGKRGARAVGAPISDLIIRSALITSHANEFRDGCRTTGDLAVPTVHCATVREIRTREHHGAPNRHDPIGTGAYRRSHVGAELRGRSSRYPGAPGQGGARHREQITLAIFWRAAVLTLRDPHSALISSIAASVV
jgi:hypothetical protein